MTETNKFKFGMPDGNDKISPEAFNENWKKADEILDDLSIKTLPAKVDDADAEAHGTTRLYSSTGDKEDGTMTQKAISASIKAVDDKAKANKTTLDAHDKTLKSLVDKDTELGNKITEAKNAVIGGAATDSNTLKKLSDKITEKTHHAVVDDTATNPFGTVKLYSSTGEAVDGAMTQNAVSKELKSINDKADENKATIDGHTKSISTINGTLKTHGQSISDDEKTLATHTDKIATLEGNISDHGTKISGLDADIKKVASSASNNAKAIETLKAITANAPTDGNTLKKVNDKITAQTSTVQELSGTVNNHSTTISQHGEAISNINAQITDLKAEDAGIKNKLNGMLLNAPDDGNTLKKINDKINSQSDSLSSLGTVVDAHGKSIDSITKQLNSNKTEDAKVKNTLDAVMLDAPSDGDTLKKINDKIANGIKPIETLSNDLQSVKSSVKAIQDNPKKEFKNINEDATTGNVTIGKGTTITPEGRISTTVSPTSDNDVTTKKYVDEKINHPDATVAESSEPYCSRSSKGGLVKMDLVGGSIIWNQLAPSTDTVNNWNPASDNTWGSLSINNKTLIYTIGNSTASNRSSTYVGTRQRILASNTSNHKVIISAIIKPSKDTKVTFNLYNSTDGNSVTSRITVKSGTKNKVNVIHSVTNRTIESKLLIYVNTALDLSEGDTVEIENVQLFDLTQMFGTEIADYVYSLEQKKEGSGLNWLKAYGFFSKDYYKYDSGSLQSVCTSGRKITGQDGTSETYSFGPNELRGLFKLDTSNKLYCDGDVYNSIGKITRKYGIVDLGDFNYSYLDGAFFCTADSTLNEKKGLNQITCLSPIYTSIGNRSSVQEFNKNAPDMSICFYGGSQESLHRFYIKNSSYTKVEDFKSAMTGVYLIYELAESISEEAAPFVNPQRSIADGTEEFVDGLDRDVMVPVGNNSVYRLSDESPLEYIDSLVEAKSVINNNSVVEEEDSIYTSRIGKNALVDMELAGGTIVWNQLFARMIHLITKNCNMTVNNDIITCTVDKDIQNDKFYVAATLSSYNYNPIAGHKYLLKVSVKSEVDIARCRIRYGDNIYIDKYNPIKNTWNFISGIATYDSPKGNYVEVTVIGSYSKNDVIYIKAPQIFDLTQMFGSTIADYVYSLEQTKEGSGLAWLKSYGFFVKDYYEYDAGSLQSVNLTSRNIISKNLLNYEAWKSVDIINGTATFENNGITLTATNDDCYTHYIPSSFPEEARIPVKEGDVVTLSWESPESANIGQAYIFPNGHSTGFVYAGNTTGCLAYEVPSGVSFITFRFGVAKRGNTVHYKNIMMRFSSVTDATHEFYRKPLVYPFDSSVQLRGLFELNANNELCTDGDSYEPDGTVIRKYGIVDLGTLSWEYVVSELRGNYFQATISLKAYGDSNILCQKYVTSKRNISISNMQDKEIKGSPSEFRAIYIKDSSYGNAADFKAAMSGVNLIYELATQTTESANSFTSPQLSLDGCTEEFVDGLERDVFIPPYVKGTRRLNDNIKFVYDAANSADEAIYEKIKNESVPINHASSSAEYGVGDVNTYGHNKIYNSLNRSTYTPGESLSAVLGNRLGSIIGTVEPKLTASKSYEIGDQFIYGSSAKLYTFTAPVAQGKSIVVDGNCKASPSVTEQIKTVDDKADNLIDSLEDLIAMINGTYEGRDLTRVFASEIASYSDEWTWVQARLNAHNISGLRVGDYIPINVAENTVDGIPAETHFAEIAGINTYLNCGNAVNETESSISISRPGKDATMSMNLTGGTIVWNQLASHENTSKTFKGVTFTNNGDGSWTLTGTPESNNVFHNLVPGSVIGLHSVNPNHVYYMNSNSSSSNNKIGIRQVRQDGNTLPITRTSTTKPIIYKVEEFDTTIETWFRINIENQTGVDIGTVRLKPQVHDLTQMFGATIADYVYSLEQAEEGSGMAWLKSYGFFTKDYYEYDPGSLQSVCTSGLSVKSKNLFNYDAWKGVGTNRGTAVFENNGVTLTATADDCFTEYSNSSNMPSRIPVKAGDVITLSWDCDETEYMGIVYIFPNGKTAGMVRVGNDVKTLTYTVPSGITFVTIRFGVGSAGNTIHYKNIMVRYASDEDATYEPYLGLNNDYVITNTQLRGLPKLDENNNLVYDGDTYDSNGKITRKYGIVNLGTLNWGKETDNNVESVFRTSFTSAAPANSNAVASDTIIASKYTVASSNSIAARSDGIDKAISISMSSIIRIVDSSYNNATDFKAAMNGVYLVYELATPVIESSNGISLKSLKSIPNGTETFINGLARDVMVPISVNTSCKYNYIVKYHIDWITRNTYSAKVKFNNTKNNNGTAEKPNPFLASDLKAWLDTTLFPLLDLKLRRVVKGKSVTITSRYISGQVLTSDNNTKWNVLYKLWLPSEYEVINSNNMSTPNMSMETVQYPIFANSLRHIQKNNDKIGRVSWFTLSAVEGSSQNVIVFVSGGMEGKMATDSLAYVPICFRTMED